MGADFYEPEMTTKSLKLHSPEATTAICCSFVSHGKSHGNPPLEYISLREGRMAIHVDIYIHPRQFCHARQYPTPINFYLYRQKPLTFPRGLAVLSGPPYVYP